MMIKIKEANVTIMVADMKKAVHFYTNILGLRLKAHYGDQFAQVEAPGTMIALHPASKNGRKPNDSQSLSIGFAVDDLDKTMIELRAREYTSRVFPTMLR